jgi:hypothetical protein
VRLDHLLSREVPRWWIAKWECLHSFRLSIVVESLKNGGLAQLGEHLLCKQGVVGSIPSSSTTILWVAASMFRSVTGVFVGVSETGVFSSAG